MAEEESSASASNTPRSSLRDTIVAINKKTSDSPKVNREEEFKEAVGIEPEENEPEKEKSGEESETESRSGWAKVLVKEPEAEAEPNANEPSPEEAVIYDAVEDATAVNMEPETPVEAEIIKKGPYDDLPYKFGWVTSDDDFRKLLHKVNVAIGKGVNPERISQGSSGSYFVYDEKKDPIGVFKPKTEEPYGHLNPKWTKWLHKTCCPCFFGRSCLMPNMGYLSEAAASLVDRHLGLNVVPRTEIVRLAAPSFHYGYWARMRAEQKQGRFPEKIGSFQLFVDGFRDAGVIMKEWEAAAQIIPPELDQALQQEFERLVILDYVIRNTDRGMDNWLIHISWKDIEDQDQEEGEGDKKSTNDDDRVQKSNKIDDQVEYKRPVNQSESSIIPFSTKGKKPIVKIAAIDNGLAFPFKHPDNWRSYPYGWLGLRMASRPFSAQTCAEFLPILSDPTSWDNLISALYLLYRCDPREYDPRIFQKQMALLRGQLHNLLEALCRRESPVELAQKPSILIEEEEDYYVDRAGQPTHTEPDDILPFARRRSKKVVEKKAWFSNC